MKRLAIIFILVGFFILGAFLYVRNQVYHSQGKRVDKVIFKIEKGEGAFDVANRLEETDLISNKFYFFYYIEINKLISKILPGEYELNGALTIPEIATLLTQKKEEFLRITFPEGWTGAQMAERLTANGLDGAEFLRIFNNPQEVAYEFDFLNDKNIKTLEGFLFPDTYFFAKDIEMKSVVLRMLRNFDSKLDAKPKEAILNKKKTILEAIIIASILEREVKTYEDREIVAGIIENRLSVGQALQCDSTLAYALKSNKKQFSFEESRTESPYNTYINKGLPPGPISNPGISSITAAIYPVDTNYNYFLNNPETGKTVFSVNFEEHKINKEKNGL